MPDTGLFLGFGSFPGGPKLLVLHYGDQLHLVDAVVNELRYIAGPRSPHKEVVKDAARRVLNEPEVSALLAQPAVLTSSEAREAELLRRGLAGGAASGRSPQASGTHFGECACIVRAKRLGKTKPRQVVLLTNDYPAHLVATNHGVATKHQYRVLKEMVVEKQVYAGQALSSTVAWQLSAKMADVSRVRTVWQPTGEEYFEVGGEQSVVVPPLAAG